MIVGLTGGIGSGKSSVLEIFRSLNVPVCSADQIARELLAPNTQWTKSVIESLGLKKDGTIDRAYLRRLIIEDPKAREILESILYPEITRKFSEFVQQHNNYPYVVLEIPLLLEKPGFFKVDRIVVVDVPENVQRQRVAERDNISELLVQQMMEIQVSRSDRRLAADDIIENTGDLDQLRRQVIQLDQDYRSV